MATTTTKRKAVGFGQVRKQTNTKTPRPEEVLGLLEWPANATYVEMRFLPATIPSGKPHMVSSGGHWIDIEVPDKVKKGKTRSVSIYKECLAYDPESQTRDSTKKCPYCTLGTPKRDDKGNNRFSTSFYALAIIRKLQEDAPKKNRLSATEKKTGVMDGLTSDAWTPVRVVKLPSSLAAKLAEVSERNFVKNPKTGAKKAFDISHEKYGIDIEIKYDAKGSGTDKYIMQKAERSPLTEEELGYLVWDLDLLPPAEELKVAKEGANDLKAKLVGGSDEDDDAEEDGDEDDDAEEDGDEDDKPAKGKKKPADDEDEDDADDEDDEDGDDLDLDEDDDEDEDDKSTKSKKKTPAKTTKKPAPVVKKKVRK